MIIHKPHFLQVNLTGQSVCSEEAVMHSAVITADQEILLATKVDRGLSLSLTLLHVSFAFLSTGLLMMSVGIPSCP